MTPVDYEKLQQRYEEFLKLGNLPEKEREAALRQLLRRREEEKQAQGGRQNETVGQKRVIRHRRLGTMPEF